MTMFCSLCVSPECVITPLLTRSIFWSSYSVKIICQGWPNYGRLHCSSRSI